MIEGLLLLAAAAALYLLPAIVAWRNNHSKIVAITVLNILLGWTALGWVVALVWSCAEIRSRPRAYKYTPTYEPADTGNFEADAALIERYARLRDEGAITADEFDERKRKILNSHFESS